MFFFYSFPETNQGIQVIAGSEKFTFERQFYKYIVFVFSLLYHIALHCILYLLYGTVTKVAHL